MGVVAPSESSERSPLSKFLSRFRSKRHSNNTKQWHDPRPPLRHSPLPLVLPENQPLLSQLGWTTVTFPQPTTSTDAPPTPSLHPLQSASQDLFKASARFFDLPESEKSKWKTRLGSEEGWSHIPGEKEFITLRSLAYTPDVLQEPAKRYWDLMGAHLDSCLGRISCGLGLADEEEQGLRRYVGPCKRMGELESEKTATMLRLFRYEGWEEKVVAEPHADLGLLSCVVGDVPGLEVWNGSRFAAIEKDYTTPCATLLGGRQLERLSNFRYQAGGHRVVSYGRPEATEGKASPRYRFSIVFVLRAHEEVVVDTDLLTTDVTGQWQEPIKDISAGKFYAQIRGAHFNINTGLQERDEQRRKIEERNKQGGKGSG